MGYYVDGHGLRGLIRENKTLDHHSSSGGCELCVDDDSYDVCAHSNNLSRNHNGDGTALKIYGFVWSYGHKN